MWKAAFSLVRAVLNCLVQSSDAFSCHLSLGSNALGDSGNSPDRGL